MRASTLVVAFLVPRLALAAGFAVAEQGAESFGVAGAATARFDLAEVGFYNPAAWARRSGVQSTVGISAILPSLRHAAGEGSTEADTSPNLPPYLYAAYGFGDVAAGVAVHVPFGNALAWPATWPGRFDVTRIRLRMVEAAPSLAYRPLEWLSVSAGPRLVLSDVEYDRRIDAVATEGSVALQGAASGWGGQISFAVGPFFEGVSFGLTYRSRVRLDYDGTADFADIPIELAVSAHDQDVTTSLTLPDRVAAGVAWAHGGHAASLDVEYLAWRTFDAFAIDFTDDATPDVVQPRDWNDTVAVRAGYEYAGLLERLSVRVGLAWDPTPSPSETLSPSLPDADRLVLTAGASYGLGHGFSVAAGYGHVFFFGGDVTGEEAFSGSYETSADVLTVGIAFAPDENNI